MATSDPYDYSDKAEMDRVRGWAQTLGLNFPDAAEGGSDKNMVGIKSDTLLFSHRLDSRTYFVQNQAYGVLDAAGVYQGPESEQIEFAKSIFQSLDLPLDEIDRTDVIREQMGGAEVDQYGQVVRLDPIREGANYIWFTRKVEGLPVWDSRLLVSLMRDKTIGFMELHWPEIPPSVLREAHRLADMVTRNWQPPPFEYAAPRQIEAGIIHSPALGFYMDVYPTIRVTYGVADDADVVIPRLHFDRHGSRSAVPRQVDLPPPEQRSSARAR